MLEAAPELTRGDHSALSHWTAALLQMFSSLSLEEDCCAYAYVEWQRCANSNHRISDFGRENVQTLTGKLAKYENHAMQSHKCILLKKIASKLILFRNCSCEAH